MPGFVSVPVIRPVVASSFNPDGNPFSEKVIGRSPVAAIMKRNGLSGLTPKTDVPLMRGLGDGRGVRMTVGSGAGVDATDAALLVLVAAVCASAGNSTSETQVVTAKVRQTFRRETIRCVADDLIFIMG